MIIVARHGETNHNQHPQRLRGWSKIPMSDVGIESSKQMADRIQKMDMPVEGLYTSDLYRSIQTAEILGKVLDVEPEITQNLRDWNYGILEGKPVDLSRPLLHRYMIQHPDIALPDGESYNTFIYRLLPYLHCQFVLDAGAPDVLTILVTHNRVIRTLLAWLSAGAKDFTLDPKFLDQKNDPVMPGQFIVLGNLQDLGMQEESVEPPDANVLPDPHAPHLPE